MRCALVPLVVAFCSVCASARQPVRFTVTSVSGRSVFLDRGRGAGLDRGMTARFFPAGEAPVEATIAEVTTSSARVDLPPGVRVPPVGCPGEVDAPLPSPAPGEAPPPAEPAPPPHPPWEREEEARTPDMPLLAPAFARRPSERAPTVHGRIYTQLQVSWDGAEDRDSRYVLSRSGTALLVTNPFGQGGELRFEGEFDYRAVELADADDESRTDLIFDEFSYAIGGEHYSPYRLEVGRFNSYFLPAVGTLDGVEGALRLESGLSIGAGAGVYPRPLPDRDWGADAGFHLFADYLAPQDAWLAATLGFLKTWHEGEADRDAIFARASAAPVEGLWLYGSCTVDLYGSDEAVKSSGPQLTEAWLQARYSPTADWGASVSYSRYTWADLKRWEFEFAPVELIRDGRLDRVELAGWLRVADDVRLDARIYTFDDQRSDGLGGEVGADWENVGNLPVTIHAALFRSDGSYLEGDGVRLEVRPGAGDLRGFLGYELFRYTNTGLIADGGDATRQTLRAGIDWQSGNWFWSLTADHYFGDGENALSLGLFAEYRF